MLENSAQCHHLQPKKKKDKAIHGLPKAMFNRLRLMATFDEDSPELTMESSIFQFYVPRVLNSCSTPCRMPDHPLDVAEFNRKVKIPGLPPVFCQPALPQRLPAAAKNKIVVEPVYPSLIPLLMTAKFSRIDIRSYDVVSQRNALRKLAVNDEDFAISVVRINTTIFLRRFAKHRARNKSGFGFQFEEMCTGQRKRDFDFNHLIEGQIGENRILMMGEVDAVRKDNGESIELKSKKSNAKAHKADMWLQSFMTGTKTIFLGRRDKNDDTIISQAEELDVETMLTNRETKTRIFNRLSCTLRFLFTNVSTGRSYMLRGYREDNTQPRLVKLFEVIDESDKKKLTFVTEELIESFSA